MGIFDKIKKPWQSSPFSPKGASGSGVVKVDPPKEAVGFDGGKITAQDPDFAAAFPEAMKEATAEAKAKKRLGFKWSSGREKKDWIRRRALAIAVEMVQESRTKTTEDSIVGSLDPSLRGVPEGKVG